MFELASRLKVRFPTSLGQLTVEDLWDLPLTSKTGKVNLDDIARQLHKDLKNTEEESFVLTPARKDKVIELKFEIVKHVIKTIMEEREEAKKKVEKKEQRQRLMALIEEKQDESLKSESIDVLKAKLKELEE